MGLGLFIEAIASGVIYDITKKIVSKTYEYSKENLKKLNETIRKELKNLLSDKTYINKSFSDNELNEIANKIAIFLGNTKIENLESQKNFMEYLKRNEQEFINILNGNEYVKSVYQRSKGDNSPTFNNIHGSISNNVIGDNSGNTTTYNNGNVYMGNVHHGDVYMGNVHHGDVYNGVDPEKK